MIFEKIGWIVKIQVGSFRHDPVFIHQTQGRADTVSNHRLLQVREADFKELEEIVIWLSRNLLMELSRRACQVDRNDARAIRELRCLIRVACMHARRAQKLFSLPRWEQALWLEIEQLPWPQDSKDTDTDTDPELL